MKIQPEVITLYKYYGFAVYMRKSFQREMDDGWGKAMVNGDLDPMILLNYTPPGICLMYMYSALYVVIEAWKNLGLKDRKIEALIDSPFIDRLRRFRNATFHYQNDIISLKHLELFGTEEEKTEVWMRQLYSELSRFFTENTMPLPEDIRKSSKTKPMPEVFKEVTEFWFGTEDSNKMMDGDSQN